MQGRCVFVTGKRAKLRSHVAEIMRAVYSRLLEKMRLDRRYSLGKLTKLWLVPRGLARRAAVAARRHLTW